MPIYQKNKIAIQNLPEISAINPNIDNIDISEINNDSISSKQLNLATFYDENTFDGNCDLVNEEATKRYNTGENGNNLEKSDLSLFYSFQHQLNPNDSNKTKTVFFEKPPIVNNLYNATDISATNYLTKHDINTFENYVAKEGRYPCSLTPLYNWENEEHLLKQPNNIPFITEISDFLTSSIHQARATYKIKYNERVSNVVRLDKFIKESDALSGAIYYSVAGFIAVKSILNDLDSGTIYLEARPAGIENAEWQTIDSAVFKFINTSKNKYSPGTYIVLSGYINTGFETRLNLNLNPQGYSMNLGDDRLLNGSLTNKYVNTFVGFAYAPANMNEDFKFVDNSVYYNINYKHPPNATEISVLWEDYTDYDNDEGDYKLDGVQSNSIAPIDSPPLYRHTRWKNITRGSSELNFRYLPEQIIKLTPALAGRPINTNEYNIDLEAIYENIYYNVIYTHGIADWSNYTDYKKSPTYNYIVHGQYNNMTDYSKGPYSATFGRCFIDKYNDYYRQVYWLNKTSKNKKTKFLESITLSDETTKVTPQESDPLDPGIYRQITFEAKYVPVRYYVKLYPGEANRNAVKTEAWPPIADENGKWPAYTDPSALTDDKLYPYDYEYTLPSCETELKTSAGAYKIHYAWEINGNNQLYTLLPLSKINLTDDFVSQSFINNYFDNYKEGPWEISAVAKYRPPFRLVFNPNGGKWYDWFENTDNSWDSWDSSIYGGVEISSGYAGTSKEIVIEQPEITFKDGQYWVKLPGRIGIKNGYPLGEWSLNSNTSFDSSHLTGDAAKTDPYKYNTEISVTRSGNSGITTLKFYAIYENNGGGGNTGCIYSSSGKISYSGTGECNNQKPGGSCGSWTWTNYGSCYVTINDWAFTSQVISNYDIPFLKNPPSTVAATLNFNIWGCHHEWPSSRHVDIYFPGGSVWKPRGTWYFSNGHNPTSTINDNVTVSIPLASHWTTIESGTGRIVYHATYGGQLKWSNLHHLIVKFLSVQGVCV